MVRNVASGSLAAQIRAWSWSWSRSPTATSVGICRRRARPGRGRIHREPADERRERTVIAARQRRCDPGHPGRFRVRRKRATRDGEIDRVEVEALQLRLPGGATDHQPARRRPRRSQRHQQPCAERVADSVEPDGTDLGKDQPQVVDHGRHRVGGAGSCGWPLRPCPRRSGATMARPPARSARTQPACSQFVCESDPRPCTSSTGGRSSRPGIVVDDEVEAVRGAERPTVVVRPRRCAPVARRWCPIRRAVRRPVGLAGRHGVRPPVAVGFSGAQRPTDRPQRGP